MCEQLRITAAVELRRRERKQLAVSIIEEVFAVHAKVFIFVPKTMQVEDDAFQVREWSFFVISHTSSRLECCPCFHRAGRASTWIDILKPCQRGFQKFDVDVLVYTEDVSGSSPLSPTNNFKGLEGWLYSAATEAATN